MESLFHIVSRLRLQSDHLKKPLVVEWVDSYEKIATQRESVMFCLETTKNLPENWKHLFYLECCNSQFCVMHETPQKMQNAITIAKDVCLVPVYIRKTARWNAKTCSVWMAPNGAFLSFLRLGNTNNCHWLEKKQPKNILTWNTIFKKKLMKEYFKTYRFKMTSGWINDDRLFTFGWTMPLKPKIIPTPWPGEDWTNWWISAQVKMSWGLTDWSPECWTHVHTAI